MCVRVWLCAFVCVCVCVLVYVCACYSPRMFLVVLTAGLRIMSLCLLSSSCGSCRFIGWIDIHLVVPIIVFVCFLLY